MFSFLGLQAKEQVLSDTYKVYTYVTIESYLQCVCAHVCIGGCAYKGRMNLVVFSLEKQARQFGGIGPSNLKAPFLLHFGERQGDQKTHMLPAQPLQHWSLSKIHDPR